MSGRGSGAYLVKKTVPAPVAKRRGPNQFDSFGEYMQVKVRKLADQLDDSASRGSSVDAATPSNNASNIFKGVSILVDGFTTPSNFELRDLVVAHGGDYQYYHTSRVTHIVTTHLPDAKVKELNKGDHRSRYVHPNWIVDSCKAAKLLPYTNYLVYQRDQPGQTSILSAFATSSAVEKTILSDPVAALDDDVISQLDDALLMGQVQEEEEEEAGDKVTANEPDPIGAAEEDQEDSSSSGEEEEEDESWAERLVRKEKELMHDEWLLKNVSTHPDFIERYFKSSRLHHLSTWKNELTRFIRELPRPARPPSATRRPLDQRTIMHIDMDCFFVSVGLKERPHLKDKPVAVCHSKSVSDLTTAEISSCNYVARSFGIRNGSWLAQARKLCPELEIVPYEFDKYKAVSELLYRTLLEYADHIQAVSCDEALLDVSSRLPSAPPAPPSALGNLFSSQQQDDFLATKTVHAQAVHKLMEEIRARILDITGCNASIGASHNILLARLSTKKAKPAGQFFLARDEVLAFLDDVRTDDLPSVGHSVGARLEALKIETCAQLRLRDLEWLQKELGNKVGGTMYNFSRGMDTRELVEDRQRKSVGAEVNWGIRFETQEQVKRFLYDLAAEVSRRMKDIRVLGRLVTFKVMKAKPDTKSMRKFLGHGPCSNVSRSAVMGSATDDPLVLGREVWGVYASLKLQPDWLRGIGIHVARLQEAPPAGRGGGSVQQTISFSAAAAAAAAAATSVPDPVQQPPLPAVDMDVFRELPGDIQHDIARELGLTVSAILGTAPSPSPKKPTATSPPRKKTASSSSSSSTSTAAARSIAAMLTMSQVDPATVAELPADIQEEIAWQLHVPPAPIHPSSSLPLDVAKLELPSPSQVDRAVWDTLPSELKDELDAAYKRRHHPAAPVLPKGKGKGKQKMGEPLPLPSTATASGLDAAFLAALPADIRREVELDHKRQQLQQQQQREHLRDQLDRQQQQLQTVPLGLTPRAPALELPKLQGEDTIEGVRRVLDSWIALASGDDGPEDGLRTTIEEFFVEHIRLRSVELPYKALAHLLRKTADRRDRWQPTLDRVIGAVQTSMRQVYGAPMNLNVIY